MKHPLITGAGPGQKVPVGDGDAPHIFSNGKGGGSGAGILRDNLFADYDGWGLLTNAYGDGDGASTRNLDFSGTPLFVPVDFEATIMLTNLRPLMHT